MKSQKSSPTSNKQEKQQQQKGKTTLQSIYLMQACAAVL